jgi:hypothetical protein
VSTGLFSVYNQQSAEQQLANCSVVYGVEALLESERASIVGTVILSHSCQQVQPSNANDECKQALCDKWYEFKVLG